MRHRAGRTALILVLVFSILVSGIGLMYQAQPTPEEIKLDDHLSKINTVLLVQAYDSDGNLKEQVVKPDDLILTNFKNFLADWMESVSESDNTVTLKDTDNVDRTVKTRIYDDYECLRTFCDSNQGTGRKGGIIAIGNGTTAPDVSDYNIESVYGAWEFITADPSWNSTTGNVTITHSFPITSTESITEVTLGTRWSDSSGSVYNFSHFRDTFSALSVEDGDTVAITYNIELGDTGFTDNFGEILAGLFASVADGGTKILTLTDFYDVGRTVYAYAPTSSEDSIANYREQVTNPSSYIQIGTSNAALDRTDHILTGQVEGDSPAVFTRIESGDVWIQGDVYCSSARSIQEAGFFMRFDGGHDNYRFMLIRDTFSSTSVGAGEWVKIKFVLGM